MVTEMLEGFGAEAYPFLSKKSLPQLKIQNFELRVLSWWLQFGLPESPYRRHKCWVLGTECRGGKSEWEGLRNNEDWEPRSQKLC